MPNTPALNPNSITVDAWIRPDSVEGFHRIVSKGQALVDLFIGPGAQLRCIFNPASLPFSCCGIEPNTTGVTVTAGVWSHVACTRDAPAGQGKVYLNGQQVGGTLDLADNNPLRSTVGDLFIGRAWFDSVSFFDGLIDEVEIFDRALTGIEIQSLFNAGQAGECKNRAPVAICQNVTVSADSSCTANAPIDNGSFDPDGNSITITQSPLGPYPLGATNVTLTVTDSNGASSTCSAIVTVVDNTPPSISGASVSPSVLWPPNHKMVDVIVSYNASDNCSSVSCSLSVTSNEPVNGTGDGDTAPDWEIVDAHHVRLRAERAGSGNGRVYTITITCTDSSGNTAIESVTVTVPHSQ